MHRRQLLATTASSGLLLSAGCVGRLSTPTDLGPPTEELDADGREKHLIYARDDENQAVLTIHQRERPDSLEERMRFRFHVWHRDGLRTDRVAFKLRAPPTVSSVPADVFLQVPDGGPWPEFDLEKTDDQWTAVEFDDIGRLGEGSLGLEFILDPVSEPVGEVAIRSEVTFRGTGIFQRDYRATGNTRFTVVTANQ